VVWPPAYIYNKLVAKHDNEFALFTDVNRHFLVSGTWFHVVMGGPEKGLFV
jgi:hypothetical protein